ncbi:hypothetical protein LTR36_010539 [Oleoguttula mirabilis]|uniref:Integral membrane protein n=1 Tax=Oleoguttula mirabilis TaxID=1507867 RepID=A0AAV9J3U3_9PEZI|nr:hypothetical protein LTR36_010539 [Oleoguttula mirabilis]
MKSLSSLLFAASAAAQLLTNGNSQLPSCATGCQNLVNAAQACGGTSTATQQIWSCFCQSAYLTTLYTSANGVCESACTSPTDEQQVMTWYTSNCGTDNGASEHVEVTTVIVTTSSAGATVAPSSSAASLPTTTATGGTVDPDSDTSDGKGWWGAHYKWVIMLIVMFIGLLLLALIAVLLKRRYDRKADQPREGFNAGITTRSTPMKDISKGGGGRAGEAGAGDTTYMSNTTDSQLAAGTLEAGSGRNTPTRTREAFMPYGYNYARSESRLASHGDIAGRKSPMPVRGGTPIGELEKEAGMGRGGAETPEKRQRRVLVRERSARGSQSPEMEIEKAYR